MPFDVDPNHGGPDDPAHNRDALRAVAGACVEMAAINAKANGLCLRCVRNMIIGRLIIAEMLDVPPSDRKEAVERYRAMLNNLFAGILEGP
jgi:hypothetical protein